MTYHPTCHSLRMIRVGDAPLRLLRAVRGIDLVELPRAEECCGFGGTFAVKNADTSMAMLGDKIRCVLDTRAEFCAAADNSCLMHIGGALHRQRAGVGTVHLAEILAATEGDRPGGRPLSRRTSRSSTRCRARSSRSRPARPSGSRTRRRSRWRTPSSAGTWARPPRRSAASAQVVVDEMPDWEALREAGRAIKERTLRHLDDYLVQLEASVTKAGGHVHWARDAAEANRIITGIVAGHGASEVVKVKSLTTDEIGLNEALGARRGRGDRDRPGRADHPARRRAVVAHPRPGDPQEPLRDPRPVPQEARPRRT